MIGKFLIILAIVVVGAIALYPQSLDFFPKDVDEAKEDLTGLKDEAVDNIGDTLGDSVEKLTTTIDDTIDKVGDEISDLNSKEIISAHGMLKKNESAYYGHVFGKNTEEKTCQISVPELAETINGVKELTHVLTLEECEFDVNDSVQIVGFGGKTSGGSKSSGGFTSSGGSNFFNFNSQPNTNTNPTEPTIDLTPNNLIFDTLSLSTVRYQDSENILNSAPNPGDVQIKYEDTSGRTISVTVTLKNAEKEIFSGIFRTSTFTTSVNDVVDTPHILEMVVEHADHGTITSSVFNPSGNFDNTINGVFVKPN